MPSRTLGAPRWALGSTVLSFAALLAVAACSSGSSEDGGSGAGSSGGGSSSGMYVETCSLGCGSGQGGASVNCTIDAIRQNQEIAVIFSQPVNIASVNSSSFQVQNVTTGSVPLGSYQVDAGNPRRLVFRPALTFDSAGQLILGFEAGETYRVTIPGTESDAGPFITSTSGRANRSRLRCDVQPNGIADVVPGSPTVQLFVDVQLFDGGGNPAGILPNQPADGQTEVSQFSPIRMLFADIMNPLTLFNPTTGTSNFILVNIDRDGNPATVNDQSPLTGEFSIFLDQALSRTQVDFTPTCIPGPGLSGREIVVRFLPGIRDLAGNELISPGVTTFTAEGAAGTAVVLPDGPEDFTSLANFDASRSGADMWVGDGQVVRGYGGGSGRLGVLRVRDGETVTLVTDMQTFPASSFPAPGVENDIISNLLPSDYAPLNPGSWPKITVTDGVFEFSKVEVEVGGRLVIQGDRPAVLLSRGQIEVNGRIEVAGETGPMHLGNTPQTFSTDGGPNGGGGGAGGTRYDPVSTFLVTGGIQGPARPINLFCAGMDAPCPPGTVIPPFGDPCCLGIPEHMDGFPGEEVGQGDIPAQGPPPTGSNGSGGIHWPTTFPTSGSPAAWNGLVVDATMGGSCRSLQVGGPGSGGGYALDGGAGVPVTFPRADGTDDPLNRPPSNTVPGSAVGLEAPNPGSLHYIRKLNPSIGHLRGGSGGGGGGTCLFNTGPKEIAAVIPCNTQNIWDYYDNSGAPGGAGGGGFMLTGGATLSLIGQIDARGGSGGSASTLPPDQTENLDRRNVTPGGGGSGGSIRLQAVDMEIRDLANRLNVTGGPGGVGVGGTVAGAGSRGLVRLEQLPAAQDDPDTMISRETERQKVEPYNPDVPDESDLHLSVGRWQEPRNRPESFSGVASCWMQANVSGCFFELAFEGDDDGGTPGDPDDDTFGWNMDVLYDTGAPTATAFPYRGIPDDPSFPLTMSIEDALGNNLGIDVPPGEEASYLIVRFQGAQSKELQLANRCEAELVGPDAEIVSGSLTPWVSHPDQLNAFVPVPNMIRFSVMFDRSLDVPGSIANNIRGITNLSINAIPD